MANHKSAKKRASQNVAKRLRNRAVKTRVKNVIKDFRLAVTNDPKNKIEEMLNITKSVIDNASKKGVLHRKTASRKISQLSKIASKGSQN